MCIKWGRGGKGEIRTPPGLIIYMLIWSIMVFSSSMVLPEPRTHLNLGRHLTTPKKKVSLKTCPLCCVCVRCVRLPCRGSATVFFYTSNAIQGSCVESATTIHGVCFECSVKDATLFLNDLFLFAATIFFKFLRYFFLKKIRKRRDFRLFFGCHVAGLLRFFF